MTPDILAAVAGILLSLAFSYAPSRLKLKQKFDALGSNDKRLVMLTLLALGSVGALALTCAGRYEALTCDADGVWLAIVVFIKAAIANQSAYLLSPKK